MRLTTANPNDNSATKVCKTISLAPSIFMGWTLLWFKPFLESSFPCQYEITVKKGPAWERRAQKD